MKTDEEILEENGWIVTCQSPFEIETEDGYHTATNGGAELVVDAIRYLDKLYSIRIANDAYKEDLINLQQLQERIEKVLEDE